MRIHNDWWILKFIYSVKTGISDHFRIWIKYIIYNLSKPNYLTRKLKKYVCCITMRGNWRTIFPSPPKFLLMDERIDYGVALIHLAQHPNEVALRIHNRRTGRTCQNNAPGFILGTPQTMQPNTKEPRQIGCAWFSVAMAARHARIHILFAWKRIYIKHWPRA